MPIDWFTVGAQLLNFIILVWLMKRFLYQPVLDAIAAREQRIAAQLADAAATKAEADRQREEFQEKNRVLDEQRAELLRQARNAAKVERDRLLLEASEEANAASAQRARALLADTKHLHAEIASHAQQLLFDISRRVLGDLAGISLEQRVCEVFIQRLQAVDGQTLATLGAALKEASDAEPALLRSAFALPDPQQAGIRAALETSFGQPVPLKFETAPELVSGIELSARGRKLAWSVSDYLTTLSAGLEKHLGEKDLA